MKHARHLTRTLSLILTVLLLGTTLLSLIACGNGDKHHTFATLADFEGTSIGVTTGSVFDQIVDPVIPQITYKSYNDLPGEIAALQKGDIDAIALDKPVAELLVAQHPEFAIFPENVAPDAYGLALQKNSPYTADFSRVIEAFKADGTLDALSDKWFSGDEQKMVIDWSAYQLEGRAGGTIRYLYENTSMPMDYVGESGQPAGFEVELVLMIAAELDLNVEMGTTSIAALINNLESDKADVCSACLSITEERRQSIDYPVSHREGGVVLVCRKERIAADRASFAALADFEGSTVGYMTGAIFEDIITPVIPGITYKTYNDLPGEIAALQKGDIDAIGLDKPVAELLVAEHPEFAIFPENIVPDRYGLALQKNSPYTADFSRIIEQFQANGTLDALSDKWFSGDEQKMVIDWSAYQLESRAGGTIRYLYENTMMPMGYVGAGGEAAGFEVELVLMIAAELDLNVEMGTTAFATIINNLASDKADVCSGCISITDERKQSIDFSTSHREGGIVLVCLRDRVAGMSGVTEESDFFGDLAASFEKTFIKENRWQLIANGLLVTLEITVLAGIIGTCLGFLLCLLLRVRNRFVSGIGRVFCKLMQGIPSLVILMIVYFVIFASSDISAVTVGILSFSLLFAVSVAGILETGIAAVDAGQWEAAAALGFSRTETFTRIILPPAIRHVLPLYKSELVSMLKLTSIVGYISIEDLTKAGDIIRSRTYEAFFPLIATAIIYFIIAWVLSFLIGRIQVGMDPRHGERRLPRGVTPITAAPVREGTVKSVNTDEELIRIEHLKKAYPNATPLSDVNTSIRRGEVITIIGPSGTGKSTLMRCVNRLETPTEGSIWVFGENVCDKKTDLNRLRRRMGMVFQSFNLFGDRTVIENVMLAPVLLKGQDKQAAYENAMRLLKAVGMAERALNFPDELSGGQKQRVAIARTLAMDPEIVLFDEPTSALDPTMVGEVLTVIRQLASEGLTMMIVTHEMKFARDVSTRIFYMDEGVIYEDGTPAEVFDEPKRDKTRAFVKRLRVLPFTITGPDYDFIAMSEALQTFGEKHLLTRRQIDSLRLAFEEICAMNIIPNGGGENVLHISTEYAEETGHLEMRFSWVGGRYDPLTEGDALSVTLIKGYLKAYEYRYDGGENRLAVTF